jgi:hypothetical protein
MIVLAAAGVGCSDPNGVVGPVRDNAQFQTDTTIYFARYVRGEGTDRQFGFTLLSRFMNATQDTLYLARCFPDSAYPVYGIEMANPPDRWGAAYNAAWACVGHESPIIVLPGATRVDTLQITGPNAWDGPTKQPFGALEGQFRLHFRFQYCRREVGCNAPAELGRSNWFQVVLRR